MLAGLFRFLIKRQKNRDFAFLFDFFFDAISETSKTYKARPTRSTRSSRGRGRGRGQSVNPISSSPAVVLTKFI